MEIVAQEWEAEHVNTYWQKHQFNVSRGFMCHRLENSLADLSNSVSFALPSRKKNKQQCKKISPFDSGVVFTIIS